VPPLKQTIHHSTIASLGGGLRGSGDQQEQGKTGSYVIDILGAGLECENAFKKLRGNDGRNMK
jgi:hypothetical protein